MAERPKTLRDVLELCRGKHGQLCIGTKSGYVFIGSVEEWDRDAPLLDCYYRELERQRFTDEQWRKDHPQEFSWSPFEGRTVRRIYHRSIAREPMVQYTVILEGNERGDCGTWLDYQRNIAKMHEKCCEWFSQDSFDHVPEAWLPRFIPRLSVKSGTDSGFSALAFAVIHRACEDYKRSYQTLRHAQKKRENSRTQTEKRTAKGQITVSTGEMMALEKWFNSLWCELLGDGLNTAAIPQNLRDLVDNEQEEDTGPCK